MFLKNYYKSGVRNAICDVCGTKFKSDELTKRWDGFMVCKPDFEYRHPMDYIRGPKGERPPEWTRPEPPDQFVGPNYIPTSLNAAVFNGTTSYLTTPSISANQITGDIDFIVYAIPSIWSKLQILAAKVQVTGNEISYRFYLKGGGLTIDTSPDGTTTNLVAANSSVIVPSANGFGIWLRGTRQINNGASGNTTNFYYSNQTPWTNVVSLNWQQLGSSIVKSGTTSIFNSTSDLEIGAQSGGTSSLFDGSIYGAYVYSGINGTLSASMVPNDTMAGTSSWVSQLTGETWSSNNANIVSVSLQDTTIPAGNSGTAGTL